MTLKTGQHEFPDLNNWETIGWKKMNWASETCGANKRYDNCVTRVPEGEGKGDQTNTVKEKLAANFYLAKDRNIWIQEASESQTG